VPPRPRVGVVVAIAAVLALLLFVAPHLVRTPPRGTVAGGADPLAALTDAEGWIGGDSISVDSLRGHTVLLIAWSDADPLCLRLLRDADAWQQAYGRFGLRVVGVHVPEFAFSADSAAPARALRRLGVRIPVALDAGSRVASRLGVRMSLPLWVVVGPDGRRRLAVEGDRGDEVQRAVVATLRTSSGEAWSAPLPPGAGSAPAVPRRVFCGSSRVTDGPLADVTPGEVQTFTAQFRYQEQGHAFTPYPVGRWKPSADGVTAARGGASDFVAIRYDGGRVHAVLGAPTPHRVWVMCDDGWLPAAERGEDVSADSRGATYVDVAEPRPYEIVRGGGAHVLRLSPEAPGVTYYLFVFWGK